MALNSNVKYPNYRYGTGISNVGSYQVSGKPFLSGNINTQTTNKIVFPAVTQWIHISSSAAVDIGMSAFGVEGDSSIGGQQSFRVNTAGGQNLPILQIKCTELYFEGAATVDVIAGLTGIDIERVTNISLSGSNWSGSLGIG